MMHKRKINLFEKILLAVGVLVIIVGYILIYGIISVEGMGWNALQTIFLWLILVIAIIVAAVNESMKEEIRVIILNQSEEIKLLRDDIKRKV